jgi:hypothetical protein
MRNSLAGLLVFLALAAGSQLDAPPAIEDRTRPWGEVPLVVDELNEACGDWWCKGEFEYTFTGCTCNFETCTIAFVRATQDSGRTPDVDESVTVDQPILELVGSSVHMHPDALEQVSLGIGY